MTRIPGAVAVIPKWVAVVAACCCLWSPASAQEALTNGDVARLAEAGIDDAVIIAMIETSPSAFGRTGLPFQKIPYTILNPLTRPHFALPYHIVAVITAWRPRNLYDTVTQFQQSINSRGFRDAVEDAIIEQVKPECLRAAEEVADSG